VIDYLDLVDYLLIAEAVTGIPAETLAKLPRIDLADSALHAPRAEFGGVEFYPEFAVKAAVLCARLLRNHPLPDGNKRTAWVSLQEFIARNGHSWSAPGVDDAEAVVVAAASGEMSEEDLAAWLAPKIVSP
jgi:death-on-curing protein